MGWMRKAATALVGASVCVLWAGSAGAQTAAAGPQCRAGCNTTYSACTRRAINNDTCLRRWHACKRKCQGRPAATTPAAKTPASAPPKKK